MQKNKTMPYTYEYPRPCVTTDSLVFRKIDNKWFILLIERGNEPYKGCWAIPGGFVEEYEGLEDAAERELKEETCLTGIDLHQLGAFGRPDRDPRHRTITVAFVGIDKECTQTTKASDDASKVQWFNIEKLPPLAFDHDEIIDMAINKLKDLE